MGVDDGLVDAVLASPLGVSWLAVLEAGPTEGEGWSMSSPTSDGAAVAAAVDLIAEMSFGTLMDAAVYAAVIESGPWIGDVPTKIAAAYRHAEQRAPIAAAVAERFANELGAPPDPTAQQWWTDGNPGIETVGPPFRRFEDVYGAGEFTWAGLQTATAQHTAAPRPAHRRPGLRRANPSGHRSTRARQRRRGCAGR